MLPKEYYDLPNHTYKGQGGDGNGVVVVITLSFPTIIICYSFGKMTSQKCKLNFMKTYKIVHEPSNQCYQSVLPILRTF